MESKNYSLFKKVILKKGKSCTPQFDGLIHRTTGEQIIRVKCYLKNYTAMAFESSQQITSVRVPKSDGLILGPTGQDTIGRECD